MRIKYGTPLKIKRQYVSGRGSYEIKCEVYDVFDHYLFTTEGSESSIERLIDNYNELCSFIKDYKLNE